MLKNKRLLIGLAIAVIFLPAPAYASILGWLQSQTNLGGGTITKLDQWKTDGTNITQNVAGRPLKLTGFESLDCLGTNGSGVVGAGTCTGGGGGSGNVATSTNETMGQLSYWTTTNGTPARLGKVATTSLTANSPLSLSQPISVIGPSASALSLSTAGDWTGTIDGNNFAGGAIGTGELLYGGSAGSLAELAAGTNGRVLAMSGGLPAWVATTTFSTGLTYSAGNVTVNTSQNISTLSNLTSNGFVITSGGTGALSIDTTTYTPTTRTVTVAGTANQITSSAGAQDLSANRTWTLSIPSQFNIQQASTTVLSAHWLKVGMTASTSIDTAGNVVIPSGSTLTNTGKSDGCASWSSAVLVSTGVACGSGGGGAGTWSTTTSQVAGQFINYPNNDDDIVTIGANSTTTAEFYFDPNTVEAVFGAGGAGDSDLQFGPANFTWIMGFDDTDDSFAIASSTVLGSTNALTIAKSNLAVTLAGSLTVSGTNFTFGGDTFDELLGDGLDISSGDLIFDCSDVASTGLTCSGENLTIDATVITTSSILDNLAQTNLADPGADQIVFWDDSDTHFDFLSTMSGLSISGNTLTVTDVTCTDCLNATEIEDIYLLNSGDAGTGVFDFGGATSFEIPNGATPTVGATGILALDTTSGNLIYATSTTGHVVAAKATSTIFSLTASTSPIVSGTVIEFAGDSLPQVITAVYCKVTSGTSLVINFSNAAGSSDTNTATCTTTGTQYAITSNNTFAAYADGRIEFGTKTGDTGNIVIKAYGYRTSD